MVQELQCRPVSRTELSEMFGFSKRHITRLIQDMNAYHSNEFNFDKIIRYHRSLNAYCYDYVWNKLQELTS